MKYATKENSQIGDTVLVPLEGEWMEDEQICTEYEIVLALKRKGNNYSMSEYLPFNDEMAYLYGERDGV